MQTRWRRAPRPCLSGQRTAPRSPLFSTGRKQSELPRMSRSPSGSPKKPARTIPHKVFREARIRNGWPHSRQDPVLDRWRHRFKTRSCLECVAPPMDPSPPCSVVVMYPRRSANGPASSIRSSPRVPRALVTATRPASVRAIVTTHCRSLLTIRQAR